MTENTGYNNYESTSEEMDWDAEGVTVPEGKFDFEVVGAEYKLTKTNKHSVNVRLECIGIHDPETEIGVGKNVFEMLMFSKGSAFRTKQFAKACGLYETMPRHIDKDVLEEWAASILGTKMSGMVKHEVYNDEKRAKIAKFLPLDLGEVQQESQDQEEEQQATPPEEEEEEVKAATEPPAPPPPAATKAVNGKASTKVGKAQQQARR